MQKVLQQLIRLQELDTRLDVLTEKLGDLPETVKTLEKQINNEIDQNNIRKTSIEENENLVRTHTARTDDLSVKIKKYKEQLYLVTTNREYDALTSEIEYNEEAIKSAEDQILQSEEENERLKEALERTEKNIEEMKTKLEQAKGSLAETQKETEEEKTELEKQREELISLIPRNFQRTYERVRGARSGLAVVPLIRDACSGCQNRVIPQKRVDIYKKNQVITCDYCGRFLYAESDTEE
jgi:uncharacterized protein